MRCLKRNKQTVYYALCTGETVQYDGDGYETGERVVTYSTPVPIEVNVSAATGRVSVEMFGNLAEYDKVLVTDDLNCPISETSVLWIDKDPGANGDVPYDYIVRRVAKSLNSVSIAAAHVEVTP